jgi:pimeloyl-ACP methyl ester carboxylesterase
MSKFSPYIILSVFLVLVVIGMIYTPPVSIDVLKEKYANPSSQFLQLSGMDVHYRIEGEGPTLVLIHGTASSLHTWDQWTEQLKSDFRIVRMDLPAFGLTGPNKTGDYSMQSYIEFLDAFLDQLDIDSCYVAGNSLGGAIAWNYALHRPDRVQKIILIDPSGVPHDEIPTIIKLAQKPVFAFFLKRVTPRSLIEKNIMEVYYDDEKVTDTLIDRYFELTLRKGNRQAFIDRSGTLRVDPVDRISQISCPTLIQWGRYDEWIPLEDASLFNEKIRESQLVVYEAGHVPMEEIPNETAADAKRFLLSNGL